MRLRIWHDWGRGERYQRDGSIAETFSRGPSRLPQDQAQDYARADAALGQIRGRGADKHQRLEQRELMAFHLDVMRNTDKAMKDLCAALDGKSETDRRSGPR